MENKKLYVRGLFIGSNRQVRELLESQKSWWTDQKGNVQISSATPLPS